MTSWWLTLTTLVALVVYVSSHSTISKPPSRNHALTSDLEDNYDDSYDFDPDSDGVEKRSRTYGFGLGKRGPSRPYRAYGFGLGKRADRQYRAYGFGLGKRARTYGFGLGKRAATSQYAFGLGKRSAYDVAPEKRQAYGFGLGKRSWGWFDGPMRDVLKRPSYGFGLGKRSAPPAEEDDSVLEDPDTAMLLLTAAEKMADNEAESGRHRVRSGQNKSQTKPGAQEAIPSSAGEAAIGVRYQL